MDTIGTATFSPEDDKLRLYPFSRLSKETYNKVKALGFKWAPKQDLFYAIWTPGREDFLLEICGEIDDEDKTLVERAEDRADRFTDYSEKRAAESEQYHKQYKSIADQIPFGQPILIGHHSEKRARRDAERIHNLIGKSVNAWETSNYWSSRAASAIAHAKYKERPDVRARRIKKLEAEQRKQIKTKESSERFSRIWLKVQNDKQALFVANRDGLPLPQDDERGWSVWSAIDKGNMTFETAKAYAAEHHARVIANAVRWLAHIENRLLYERAMLAEAGGIATDQVKPEVGGACKCWASPQNGYSYIVKVNKVTVTILDKYPASQKPFKRTIEFDKLSNLKSKAEVDALRENGKLLEASEKLGFFIKE
jgi:hypothetical protein